MCDTAGAGIEKVKPQVQEASSILPLFPRNFISETRSQEYMFVLMKLLTVVNKITPQHPIKLLRMGSVSLPGSRSIWQISWEVIVTTNKTENLIYVVLPPNEQPPGSGGSHRAGVVRP